MRRRAFGCEQETRAGHGECGPFGPKHEAEGGFEEAGGDWEGNRVIRDRPTEVLQHLPHGAPTDLHRSGRHADRVGAHQDDICGFDGDIGTGADGDAEVGWGEGGSPFRSAGAEFCKGSAATGGGGADALQTLDLCTGTGLIAVSLTVG